MECAEYLKYAGNNPLLWLHWWYATCAGRGILALVCASEQCTPPTQVASRFDTTRLDATPVTTTPPVAHNHFYPIRAVHVARFQPHCV